MRHARRPWLAPIQGALAAAALLALGPAAHAQDAGVESTGDAGTSKPDASAEEPGETEPGSRRAAEDAEPSGSEESDAADESSADTPSSAQPSGSRTEPPASERAGPNEPVQSTQAPVTSSEPTSGETTQRSSTGRGRASAPPPPPAEESTRRQQRLSGKKKKKNEGVGSDIFWIEPTFGYSYINLVQFNQDNFFPSAERTKDNGYVAGVGLGFRIKILTLGGRVSFAKYPDFDLGTAVFDAGLRIPLGVVEPYFRLGIGYAWVGSANYGDPGLSETDIYGLAAEAGAGVDFYFNKYVAIGIGMDAAVLNLSRQDVRDGCTGGVCDPSNFNLEEDGDSVGLQVRAHGHLSLHF